MSQTAWTDLTAADVVRARRDVALRAMDDGTVVYDGGRGRAHVLNGTAAVVWELLDGSCTVEVLAADVADAYGISVDDVRDQIMALLGDLGRWWLLEGVTGHESAAEPSCP